MLMTFPDQGAIMFRQTNTALDFWVMRLLTQLVPGRLSPSQMMLRQVPFIHREYKAPSETPLNILSAPQNGLHRQKSAIPDLGNTAPVQHEQVVLSWVTLLNLDLERLHNAPVARPVVAKGTLPGALRQLRMML